LLAFQYYYFNYSDLSFGACTHKEVKKGGGDQVGYGTNLQSLDE